MNDLFNLDTWSTEYTALIWILNLQKIKKPKIKKNPEDEDMVKYKVFYLLCHMVWNTTYGKCVLLVLFMINWILVHVFGFCLNLLKKHSSRSSSKKGRKKMMAAALCRLTFWPPVSVCRPHAPSWSSPCPAHSAACCWTTRITKQPHQHTGYLTQIRSLKTLPSLLVYVKRDFVRIRCYTH